MNHAYQEKLSCTRKKKGKLIGLMLANRRQVGKISKDRRLVDETSGDRSSVDKILGNQRSVDNMPGNPGSIIRILANKCSTLSLHFLVTLLMIIYGSGTNTERNFRIEQIRQRSKVELNFYLRVDPETESGVYQTEFTIKDKSGTSFSRRIPVRVEGNPDLVLSGSEILSVNEDNSSSEAIVPGQEFYLRTSVKNAGNGNAKNVRVILNLNNSSPLIPLEDNVRFFENLSAGSSKNLSFKLLLGSNADVKPYRIPLRITASNNTETFQIDKIQEIGINVLNRAQIDISSLKFDPEMPVKGQQVSLTLRLENVGKGEARSVKAKLEGLKGSGSTSAFLGRLDKDDDAPAVFTFTPGKTGDQNMTLLVEYEDDFGEHQVSENLTFNVKSQEGSILPIVLGAVLVLVAAILYMKKKGKL